MFQREMRKTGKSFDFFDFLKLNLAVRDKHSNTTTQMYYSGVVRESCWGSRLCSGLLGGQTVQSNKKRLIHRGFYSRLMWVVCLHGTIILL